MPAYERKVGASALASMYDLHALPNGWAELEYQEFLVQRRKLMADVIRRGFDVIGSGG